MTLFITEIDSFTELFPAFDSQSKLTSFVARATSPTDFAFKCVAHVRKQNSNPSRFCSKLFDCLSMFPLLVTYVTS